MDATQSSRKRSVLEAHIRQLEADRDALQRQLVQADALQEISHALTSTLELQQVLTLILELAGRVIVYDSASVMLAMPDQSGVVIVACRGFRDADSLIGKTLSFAETQVSAQAMAEQQPMIIGDVQQHPGWTHNRSDLEDATAIRAWIGVPLVVDGESIGMLTFDKHVPDFYSSQDVSLASAFAAQAALAVRNARLFEQAHQRANAMTVLQQVGLDLAERAEALDAVLALVLERACTLFRSGGGEIWLWNEDQGRLDLATYRAEDGPDMRGTHLKPGEGLVGRVFESGELMLVDDYANWPHALETWKSLSQHALMGTPLTWQTHKIGVLVVCHTDPAAHFEPDDARLLVMLANQAAAAIANARLLGETLRRLAELEALNEIGRAISSTIQLDALMTLIYQRTGLLMDTTNFYIALYDEERNWIDFAIEFEEGCRRALRGRAFADGLTEYILRTRRPLFMPIPSRLLEIQGSLGIQAHGRPANSWLGVPMVAGDRALGVIAVQSYEHTYAYDQHDLRVLSLIAAQAAIAVQNARLYEKEQQRVKELEARQRQLVLINQVARQTTGMLTLEVLLDTAVRSIYTAFGYQNVGILLLEKGDLVLKAAAGQATEGQVNKLRIAKSEGLTGWAMQHKQTVVVGDTRLDPRYHCVDAGTYSEAVLPLIASDQVLGVLNVESSILNAFGCDEIMGLETVADQLTGAIANARLYAEAQQRTEELRQQKSEAELLYQAAHSLSMTLDANALLNQLLLLAASVVEFTNSSVFLLDEQGCVTHRVLTRQDLSEIEAQQALDVVLDRGLAGWVYKHAYPALVVNTQVDERWVALGATYEMVVGSVLCVPLMVRGVVRGIFTLMHSQTAHFTPRHQRALVAVTQQAATALENIYLYQRERERAEQLALLHRVSAAVSSSLDITEVLRMAATRLVQSFDVDHCGIVMFDQALTHGRLMAEYPLSGITGLRFPLDDPMQGELIATRQPMYIADVEKDERLRSTTRATLLGTDVVSTLIVPLVVKDRIIGSFGLDVRNTSRRGTLKRLFSDEDIELSCTIAAQIAIAVDNARLYEESVTRVEHEMSIARQIQRNLFPRDVPRLPNVCVSAVCLPARETGGDFYEFVILDEKRLGVIVGDVSGKGLPAAMLMAAARSTARAVAHSQKSPSEVLNAVNHLLCDDVPRGDFVAMSYAIVDLAQGRLGVSNAGQVLPLVLPAPTASKIAGVAGRSAARPPVISQPVDYVRVPGPKLPLGLWPDLEYCELWRDFHPGDTVLFFTDGIVEAHNAADELFGFDRLESLACRLIGASTEDVLAMVLAEVRVFVRESDQHDDMTIVVVQNR